VTIENVFYQDRLAATSLQGTGKGRNSSFLLHHLSLSGIFSMSILQIFINIVYVVGP